MMISPEEYYEEHLKGKTAAQIMTAIRGLKKEMGHLKNTMERPDYGSEPVMHPSESTRLWCTRLYLERAKEALAEVGGTYISSQAELKAADFERNISAISRVIFSIGGFFGGYETRTYTLNEEHLYLDVEHSLIPKPTNFAIETDYPCSKEESLTVCGNYILENGAASMTCADLAAWCWMERSGSWRFIFPMAISQ